MQELTKRSTADDVLEGLDLTGKNYLLTGCATGIGFETMRSLAAHGGHIIATARSLDRAKEACAAVTGRTTPISCDQDDFAAVATAVKEIKALGLQFDAIIANAGIMGPTHPNVRYGVESQFRVNHLSHMLLVMRLKEQLRDDTGRLVMVSSGAAQSFAPKAGILFDNLDASLGYRRFSFYGQSKLANISFAKSMAERLRARGITSNALHPGVIVSTGLTRSMGGFTRMLLSIAAIGSKTIPQGAATTCYVAAHPAMAGKTGGFYADCRLAKPNAHAEDPTLRQRLWDVSANILAEYAPA